jgi:endonuclease YncB( thermonuclease family)
MRWQAIVALSVGLTANAVLAADVTAINGDTVRLDRLIFRLQGVNAPELDQTCLDDKGVPWSCGIAARDRLDQAVKSAKVDCDDQGVDPLNPRRRLGLCWLMEADISLNQRVVREGWALSFAPAGRRGFKADQDDAQDNQRGLWKGCFTSAADFRRWEKGRAELRGQGCRLLSKQAVRDLLFPTHPSMPPGCAIKGNNVLRAQVSGHRGVYHLPSCRSYQRAKWPNRWFCSEEDARAAGYRKSLTC